MSISLSPGVLEWSIGAYIGRPHYVFDGYDDPVMASVAEASMEMEHKTIAMNLSPSKNVSRDRG